MLLYYVTCHRGVVSLCTTSNCTVALRKLGTNNSRHGSYICTKVRLSVFIPAEFLQAHEVVKSLIGEILPY